MKTLSSLRAPVALLFLLLASALGAHACPACYGDTSGSKMADAATVGIFAMVVIMFFMLGAIGLFMRHLAYRAKHPLPDYDELLSETEDHPESGASD
jgi:hypothetical protein